MTTTPHALILTRQRRFAVLLGIARSWGYLADALIDADVLDADDALTEWARVVAHPYAASTIAFHLSELRAAVDRRDLPLLVDDAVFPLLTGHPVSSRCMTCALDRHAPEQEVAIRDARCPDHQQPVIPKQKQKPLAVVVPIRNTRGVNR